MDQDSLTVRIEGMNLAGRSRVAGWFPLKCHRKQLKILHNIVTTGNLNGWKLDGEAFERGFSVSV